MKKVIHLPFNLASQIGIINDALRKDMIDSSSAFKSNFMSEYNPDFELSGNKFLSIFRRLFCFIRSVGQYDIYFHHTGGTLLSHFLGHMDARINVKLGKKCVPIFHGSELRRPSLEFKMNPFYEITYNEDDHRVLKTLQFWSSISNDVVVCDASFLDYGLNEYFKNVYYIPIAIDLLKYRETLDVKIASKTKKKKIVHLPTHPQFKGTKHVREAIKDLESDGVDFDYLELTGIPHAQAKKELLNADLVIDQMMVGAYGVLAIEAMALGKPVVAYIKNSNLKHYPVELPIINCTPDTLKSTLFDWLSADSGIHEKQRVASLEYVEKYHASDVISRKYKALIKNL